MEICDKCGKPIEKETDKFVEGNGDIIHKDCIELEE